MPQVVELPRLLTSLGLGGVQGDRCNAAPQTLTRALPSTQAERALFLHKFARDEGAHVKARSLLD